MWENSCNSLTATAALSLQSLFTFPSTRPGPPERVPASGPREGLVLPGSGHRAGRRTTAGPDLRPARSAPRPLGPVRAVTHRAASRALPQDGRRPARGTLGGLPAGRGGGPRGGACGSPAPIGRRGRRAPGAVRSGAARPGAGMPPAAAVPVSRGDCGAHGQQARPAGAVGGRPCGPRDEEADRARRLGA